MSIESREDYYLENNRHKLYRKFNFIKIKFNVIIQQSG